MRREADAARRYLLVAERVAIADGRFMALLSLTLILSAAGR